MNSGLGAFRFAAIALSFASVSAAAAPQPSYSGWSWSGQIEHINIDPEVANRPDIQLGDSATAIGFAAEHFSDARDTTYSLGLSYIFYNDNNEFYQYVYDDWDGAGYEQTNATALMAFVEAGQRFRFGSDALSFFSVRGGLNGIFASDRSIPDCSNCYSEDLDIDGGLYGVLGVGRSLNSVDMELQFQQYFSGDLDNSLRLKISTIF